MHIHYSVHINRSVGECAATLAQSAQAWFPHLDADSSASVGVKIAGVPLRKRVAVELGEPKRAGDWTNVPVSWKATFARRLFPEMTGRIELVPVESDVTRLTVSGMYEPPLGKLGEQLDEAVMHNVAEATVRELAESIGQKLSSAAGT